MKQKNILIGIEEENKNIESIFKFTEVEDVLIRGLKITDADINNINKVTDIKSITFENCIFNTEEYITLDIKSANFYLCKDIYTQMLDNANKLEKLVIRNCSNVNLKGIMGLKSLKELYLQKQLGVDFSYIDNSTLEYVNLDESNVFNMEEKVYPFKISRKEKSIL